MITLALVTTGHLHTFHVPLWVILSAAGAMGLGTWSGGWRIIRTLGQRVVKITPVQGFAAESSGAAVLLFAAYGYALPVSSTHVITSAIMGSGATQKLSAVRWGLAGNIAAAWVLTIPAAAAVAAAAYGLLHLGLG